MEGGNTNVLKAERQRVQRFNLPNGVFVQSVNNISLHDLDSSKGLTNKCALMVNEY